MFKVATVKGKDILSIGSIFFALKVAPKRIDYNIKSHYIEKPPKLNYPSMLSLRSLNFYAAYSTSTLSAECLLRY